MSLFALITALSLEQLYPLTLRGKLSAWLNAYLHFLHSNFNAGEHQHGQIAWLLAVLPFLFIVLLLHYLLRDLHPLLAWGVDVVVLYLTMGFREYSHFYTGIQAALRQDDLAEARRLLAVWRSVSAPELNGEEVARLSIEQALLAGQHRVFGVMVWFVLFSVLGLGGAAGALLYRFAHQINQRWQDADEEGRFSEFARHAWSVIAWLPTRLNAITFAIVGNFEDTLYCWRHQAGCWPDQAEGIVLASGAGSLGVRLGMGIAQGGIVLDRPELGLGDDADTDFMQNVIGLVGRSVVFWLIFLLMLSLANLLG